MPTTDRATAWAQDVLVAAGVGVLWFTVQTVLERGDYWYPRSASSYAAAGAWTVAAIALRRVAPGPLFWATVMLYPVVLDLWLQTPVLALPLVVVGFAATRSGAVPVPLAMLATAVSAVSLTFGGRPWVAWPYVGRGPLVYPPEVPYLVNSPSDVALVLALTVGAVVAGAGFRRLAVTSETLRERNAELQELQEALAERAVLEERTRIARELHDVVAHHMSAIVVRAQAADRVAPNQPDAPRDAVRWITDEGKRALTSMRSVVHVLRRADGTDAGGVALSPTPGTAEDTAEQLRDAARRLTDAGRHVDLAVPEPWPTTTAETGLAVVRITQEALTNVLLHSLAQAVAVTITASPDRVHLRVHDPGPPLPDDPGGREGFGLASMRERAGSAGGRLVAGPDGRGGWCVEADLPRGAR